MPLAKKRLQRDGSVMIWAGIIDQTNIEPFKVNKGVKLNSANYRNFMDKTFFAFTSSSLVVLK